jgi:hypothetical protein
MATEDALEELTQIVEVPAERVRHQVSGAPRRRERVSPPAQLNETVGILH